MDIVDYANHIERGLSHKEIALLYGYTREQLIDKLIDLGVEDTAAISRTTDNLTVKSKPAKYSYWMEEEIEFLKENYTSMTNRELSKKLNRSAKAVGSKANSIGCEHKKPRVKWTKEEEKIIEQHYKHLTDKELGKILNRSHRSVRHRRVKMGLSKYKK